MNEDNENRWSGVLNRWSESLDNLGCFLLGVLAVPAAVAAYFVFSAWYYFAYQYR